MEEIGWLVLLIKTKEHGWLEKKIKHLGTRIGRDTSRFAQDHTRWSRATSSKVWMSKRGAFQKVSGFPDSPLRLILGRLIS